MAPEHRALPQVQLLMPHLLRAIQRHLVKGQDAVLLG
jgi:hypothetical protein